MVYFTLVCAAVLLLIGGGSNTDIKHSGDRPSIDHPSEAVPEPSIGLGVTVAGIGLLLWRARIKR